ncbi:NAD(P)/FAD-dependent oxidoreductase [Streptomyces sp. AJS327]|uniref:NAD(P)/FAD-dependent oxidoreductase n=1 Tax=Streptomyces sp. AJS327 TaxID=2545265 RepID=UPI0015DF68B5|nr:FAD-dependent oxidoreductase [Streptomyces sp. AJS327]MBA0051250.1 NAD(P)/FAD-dependent oxidoreductase [Streptomyces sp. AJS327]
MTRTLLLAGYGPVGHRTAERLRTRDTGGAWRVVILAEEAHPAYDRVHLSSYLDGKGRGDLTLTGATFASDPLVDLRLSRPATAIDRAARTVRTADGDEVPYDALVLATGSRPFVPPVPGHDLPGCHVYRTFEDLDALRAAARPGRPAVVVGGGLLGLEAASALRLLGARPHVVETAPHLMPAQLDASAARVLHRHATLRGVDARCATGLDSVEAGPDGTVAAVSLSDGTVLETDLVVFAAGIRPRDELAVTAGLDRGPRGGVAVDAYCRTSDPRVWAVGECAAVEGRCHGLVAPGYRMADSVVEQLLGQPATPFDSTSAHETELKLLGVNVAVLGDTVPDDQTLDLVFAEDATRHVRVLLRRDTGILVGGVLAGDTCSPHVLAGLIGRPLPADLEQLLLPAPGTAHRFLPGREVPTARPGARPGHQPTR